MKYVGVKHKPEHENVFWFSVPESISDYVIVGTQVLCNTKKGENLGIVERVMEGVSRAEAVSIIGDYFPLKSILAVKRNIELSDIHIPWDMHQSTPSPEKIANRINELYHTGSFNTPVICSADNNLRDGYTAYLVAKMFGHETLSVFCVVSD